MNECLGKASGVLRVVLDRALKWLSASFCRDVRQFSVTVKLLC